MPSNHLILCHPLLLLSSIFSSIRVFFNESVLRIRWPKYWSFNFSISPSNEYSGLISFRIDWFDLLADHFSWVLFSHSVVSNSLWPRLPEFAQTHVYQVGDASQPCYPLSSHSPPAFNLPQHWSIFQWVSSSHQVAKVLEFQFQDQSFQWTLRTDLLEDGLVRLPCSPRDSQESSPTPQFKSINYLDTYKCEQDKGCRYQ